MFYSSRGEIYQSLFQQTQKFQWICTDSHENTMHSTSGFWGVLARRCMSCNVSTRFHTHRLQAQKVTRSMAAEYSVIVQLSVSCFGSLNSYDLQKQLSARHYRTCLPEPFPWCLARGWPPSNNIIYPWKAFFSFWIDCPCWWNIHTGTWSN